MDKTTQGKFWPAKADFTETYTVEMTKARNGRAIYCVITDAYGNTATTNTVFLTIDIQTPVAINVQPVNTAVAVGEELVVKLEAQGEGLTYRWYYKDVKMADFLYTKTFTGDTYTIPSMTASRSGRQIYCVVTDQYGNSVTSDTVTIAVIK